jgi:hypothetical protein
MQTSVEKIIELRNITIRHLPKGSAVLEDYNAKNLDRIYYR